MGTAITERLRKLSAAAKVSAQTAKDDREARNAEIGQADRQGYPIREIARITEMSPAHIQRIVLDQVADDQDDDEGTD